MLLSTLLYGVGEWLSLDRRKSSRLLLEILASDSTIVQGLLWA